jgi:hypothetical protein
MTDRPNRCETGVNLIKAADDANLSARLLGGIAIALHSPSAGLPAFKRDYDDIDIVIEKRGRKHIDAVMADCGYEPDVEFNNLHGLERRTYYSESQGKLDVFVGEFSMCHALSFDGRLQADHPTVPLADLLLTKAQIYELNRKDAYDLIAMLVDHEIGPGDDDVINADRIAQVCGSDWGFWRTVNHTIDTVEHHARSDVELEDHRERVLLAIATLRDQLERAPKSAKWKLRAKVGDRKIWYTLPEDPDRHPAVA